MAELTKLESKLGEVIGLAMAAQKATGKIKSLVEDEELQSALERMNDDAAETEKRGVDVAGDLEGKKTAVLEEARETRSKADDMMSTYLDDDADGLDGFEFLTMAEAGEVGHWKVLGQMAEKAARADFVVLAEWAIPIQERHLSQVQTACLELARREDPTEGA